MPGRHAQRLAQATGGGGAPCQPRRRSRFVAYRHPSSIRCRSALTWLHRRQAATTLSQTCWPPRLRGMTWSTLVATAAAVHAPPAVPREQGAPGERYGPPVGDLHESFEADHAGRGARWVALCRIGAGFLQAHRLVLEDEDERAAERYDTERLVRRVEDQDMRHGCLLVAGGAWLAPGRSALSLPDGWSKRHHARVTG